MSSNGVPVTEDADMGECDGEKVVTMMDVLQEQQDFEEDANAVLGASDDKDCTYLKGYIKRQALYACLTCCSEAKNDPTKRAGVCLACSLNCHENHELVELYTKRNFRCDCGNPKFNSHPCQYTTDKPDFNEENSYNQNFSGLYCICHRPYPDPEATFEDEMIQCIICEDWLHASHLEETLPSNEQYAEMVCKACMEKNEFLHDYYDIAVNSETAEVDVLSLNDTETPKVNGVSTDINDDKEIKVNDEEMTETEKVPNNQQVELAAENKVEGSKESTVRDISNDSKTDTLLPDVNSITNDSNVSSEKDPAGATEENNMQNETKASEVTNDEPNINITNDAACENTDKDNETKNEESMENKDASEDSKKETCSVPNVDDDAEDKKENNENSIIESIEKLENELGNVESKGEEKNEQTPTSDNSNNDDVQIESKNENSITAKAESDEVETDVKVKEQSPGDKPDGTEPKTSDVEMNEDNAKTSTDSIDNNDTVNVTNGASDTISCEKSSGLETKLEDTSKDIKRKLSTEDSDEMLLKKPKLDEKSKCSRPRGVKRFKGATFWPCNFRTKLCICNECISMYKDLSVLFLTDPDDTVTAYEALGKQKIDGSASSQYERGLEALSSLDRIQQINALTEYNKMRDKLLDFLKSFKDRKEVVKEEDIKAFFAGMKPKREPDGVYFCR